MKHFGIAVLAAGVCCSAALASDLNVSVKADKSGTNTVEVEPNEVFTFYIEGLLSDDMNEGLALVGFNLHFTGGPLTETTVDVPVGEVSCGNPMPNFVKPEGITNPAGINGTVIADKLVQVGGAQNSIRNTADNAPFPVGMVLTGIAQPSVCGTAVLATGTLTAPAGQGTYTLELSELFANVITLAETGNVFWATEAAGVGTIDNLTVNVSDILPPLLSSAPACDTALSRAQGNVIRLTFDGAVIMPTAGEIVIRQLDAAGAFTGADLSPFFSYSLEAGDTVLRIEETGTALTDVTWYGIVNDGTWASAANFEVTYPSMPGNVNDDGFTNFIDLSAINANRTDTPADDDKYNINADGFVNFIDISLANTFVQMGSTRPDKPAGHDCAP